MGLLHVHDEFFAMATPLGAEGLSTGLMFEQPLSAICGVEANGGAKLSLMCKEMREERETADESL